MLDCMVPPPQAAAHPDQTFKIQPRLEESPAEMRRRTSVMLCKPHQLCSRKDGVCGPAIPFGSSEPIHLVGRSQGCDVALEHPSISRHHALLYHGPSGFVVEDLGSTHGTFVADIRAEGLLGRCRIPQHEQVALRERQVVLFGASKRQYFVHSGASLGDSPLLDRLSVGQHKVAALTLQQGRSPRLLSAGDSLLRNRPLPRTPSTDSVNTVNSVNAEADSSANKRKRSVAFTEAVKIIC